MSAYRLAKNAKVALVCTGTPCQTAQDARATVEFLAQHHIDCHFAQETYTQLPALRRAEILYDYLADDSLSAIWALRGGEGSADLIPYLAAKAHNIRRFRPKLLLGFSDFTPVLVYFQKQFAWQVVHGPVARQLVYPPLNQASKRRTLHWLQQGEPLSLTKLLAMNSAANRPRKIIATFTGGNLTLVHLSLQDSWQVDSHGKFLLLEEVNEQPYQVIRTLKHLLRINFFSGAKAVLLAGFDFPDRDSAFNEKIKPVMQQVLQEFAQQLSVPVLFTDQIGHGEFNCPIPFFLQAELTLGVNNHLQFKE